MSRSAAHAVTERLDREDSAAAIARWHAQGGYEGALGRQSGQPIATREHIPFPGHRTMRETG